MTKDKLSCDDLMPLILKSAMLDTRRLVGKQKNLENQKWNKQKPLQGVGVD